MALRVYILGVLQADGGATFVCDGGAANAVVEWSLTGNGTLTPTSARTDANGIASARYSATSGTPAIAGSTVTVGATVYGS